MHRQGLAGLELGGAPRFVGGYEAEVATGLGPGSGGGWITLAALRVDQFGRPLTPMAFELKALVRGAGGWRGLLPLTGLLRGAQVQARRLRATTPVAATHRNVPRNSNPTVLCRT